MPASIVAVAQDTADAGDFIFEEAANGQAYIVTGLTEQGRSKETLHIPAAYQGKPVAAIASDALTNAANLVELHIPESVETLPDSLFVACPALRRLVLAHTAAPCGLSAHSLDGAEALQILVPASAYPWYRDGYGCEDNPWRTYLDQIYAY